MTRRIACLATLPGDTTDSQYAERIYTLFDSIRIYNKEHDIKGAFLVHHQSLLLVLEGEADKVARLVYHLGRNPLVSSVSAILNRRIAHPLFNRWTIKLLNEGRSNHADFLTRLYEALRSQWHLQHADDKTRLMEFFPDHQDAVHTETRSVVSGDFSRRYRQMYLSMKAWPRPTQLRLTADLIKLCPRLIGRQIGYQRLLDLKLFSSEEKLLEQLRLLDHVQALQLSPLQQGVAANGDQPNAGVATAGATAGSLFSQALRKFIHARSDREIGGSTESWR